MIDVTTVTKNAASLEYMYNADYVRMVAALNKEFGKSYRWMGKCNGGKNTSRDVTGWCIVET